MRGERIPRSADPPNWQHSDSPAPAVLIADLRNRWPHLKDVDRAIGVREVHLAGMSLREIAGKLNCSPTLVRRNLSLHPPRTRAISFVAAHCAMSWQVSAVAIRSGNWSGEQANTGQFIAAIAAACAQS